MHVRALAISIVLLANPVIADAGSWISADGFLSVTPPDSAMFQEIQPPPPPFMAMWISDDETMRFGVMAVQVSPSVKLNQSSAEEGFAKVGIYSASEGESPAEPEDK